MRIGVSFRHDDEAGGGGHTFESEIVREVVRRPTPAGDELVLVGPFGPLLTDARHRDIETIGVPTRGVARALLKLPDPRARRGRYLGTRIDRRLSSAHLDFLWCVGQDVPSFEIPFAMTVWDLQHRLQPFFPEVSAGGEWSRRERYFAAALRRATIVVVGTEAGKAEVQRFYAVQPERILVLPHPTPTLSPADADDTVLSRHRLSPGFLLYPAQFWPHKNHASLLLALHALRERGLSPPPLVLVGADKGNRAHVEALARELGILDSVRLLGFVTRAELVALYRHAGALTYVTFFGPENLPPLEAFALGCPVIASRVPGSSEQFADAALLIDPSDQAAIADAIDQVLNDQLLRQGLIERGRARALRSTPATFVEGALRAIHEFDAVRRNWAS